jgi:hypothetical protein
MVTAHPPSLRRGTQADAHGPQHVCSSTFFIDAKLYQKAKHPRRKIIPVGIFAFMQHPLLLAEALFDGNGDGDGSTDHGVVACSERALQIRGISKKMPLCQWVSSNKNPKEGQSIERK